MTLVTIDPDNAIWELREAGIRIENTKQKIIDIANDNSSTPQEFVEIILRAAEPVKNQSTKVPSDFPSRIDIAPRLDKENYRNESRTN